MRLQVRHETHYSYETPVTASIQRLTLTPPSFGSQKVVQWAIEAPGMDSALVYRDGFGNQVHLVTEKNRHETVAIIAQGTVDCADAAGVVRGLFCPAPDGVFLRQTEVTQPSDEIRELAEAARRAGGSKTLNVLHALMAAIHERIAYEIGVTDTRTTAAEALILGRGVCQDHTHVFLSAARHIRIPGRYVTGYLATEEGEVATAAHSWAEALVPDLGWVGFDAANGKCPTDHYVRVATGLDAPSVIPVRGSRRGGAQENMTVSVSVQPAEQ
jgi:transglutaminase-like putative cysteine protease